MVQRQQSADMILVLAGDFYGASVQYMELLLHKLTRGTIPVSYLLFGLTGSVGVIVNFLLAALFGYWLRLDFRTSQLAGALITIAVNFLLNNQLTFRSARLRGVNLLAGLVVFYFCCLIGLFAQVTVATSLHTGGMNWFAATLAGIALGSVWNYSTAYLFVWQVQRRRTERLGQAYAEAVRLKSTASR
jgi:dolichol-phosphate mannosyltransferase